MIGVRWTTTRSLESSFWCDHLLEPLCDWASSDCVSKSSIVWWRIVTEMDDHINERRDIGRERDCGHRLEGNSMFKEAMISCAHDQQTVTYAQICCTWSTKQSIILRDLVLLFTDVRIRWFQVIIESLPSARFSTVLNGDSDSPWWYSHLNELYHLDNFPRTCILILRYGPIH